MDKYRLTLRMRIHVIWHGAKWVQYEMSQKQCREVGFLSGNRGDYYCYNNIVQRCGNVIRFTNNCIGNSSLMTKYDVLQ